MPSEKHANNTEHAHTIQNTHTYTHTNLVAQLLNSSSPTHTHTHTLPSGPRVGAASGVEASEVRARGGGSS